MTTEPARPTTPEPFDGDEGLSGLRVFVSGALHMLPQIGAMAAGGVEVVVSDRDAPALAEATAGMGPIGYLPADLDLTLDAHRLAAAVRRMGGCDVVVHHMGADADPTADGAANAFLRAMRLIHALRPQLSGNRAATIILTGCPDACARSLDIVLDRAGTFCARTGMTIVQCAPEGLLDHLRGQPRLIDAAAQAVQAVALAG